MELRTFMHDGSGWDHEALRALDSDRTLAVAFGASSTAAGGGPTEELASTLARSTVIGCSTAGEIFGTQVHDESVCVGVVRFGSASVRSTAASVHSASESLGAGQRLARDLDAEDLRAVLVLSDGLTVNGSELVRGLASVLPRSVVVTGGLAADGDRFRRTWVLHEGCTQSGLVCAVGLFGPSLRVGHGSKGGWDIFGVERVVTRAHGNVLYELDGKPALQLYKEYLGERAAGLPATALLFPLALRGSPSAEVQTVRTVLAVDELEQSMTFAGDIPEGCLAQLMRANFDRLVQGASDAAMMAGAPSGVGPVLSVAISCVGRRLVLGERAEEEVEASLEALPPGTQQVGFYSYGEISPHTSGTCELHNQTMTLTTIAERT